jgi:hypothetical protein
VAVPRPRPATAALLAAFILLLGWILVAPAAQALPPGGASSDTPGTSSSVTPSTLAAGDTISFTVSGFPAGETVYVKIDDGVGYGDTSVQGSGVVFAKAIPSSGTVSGSFQLPSGITTGSHWLRFLASEVMYDASGAQIGTKGYSNRGNSDFTVVSSSSTGSGSSTSGSGSGSTTGGGSGASSDSGTTTITNEDGTTTQQAGEGGVLTIDPSAVPSASASASPSGSGSAPSSATPSASAQAGAQATDADAQSGQALAAVGTGGGTFPVVGVVGAGIIVLLGAGIALWMLRREPSPALVGSGDGSEGRGGATPPRG